MFEVVSAMTLMVGLQTAPEQIKIAQILERYEKVAMEPKALKIEFSLTTVDAVDHSTRKHRGLFGLQRENSGLAFSVIPTTSEPYSEFYTFKDSTFIFRGFFLRDCTRMLRVDDANREFFWDYWIRTSFPLHDSRLFKRDHNVTLVKEDEFYHYVVAIPHTTKSGHGLREYYHQLRLVFMKKETDKIPAGALRRMEIPQLNYDVLILDIDNWRSNSIEDKALFPVRVPNSIDGKIHEILVDGQLKERAKPAKLNRE